MKRFVTLWKNLTVCEEAIAAHTPRITKELPIVKWVDVFGDHLCRSIGGRKVPLIYVVRILVVVPVVYPLLKSDQPYSKDFGLIDKYLITCMSHNHGLFR